MRRLLALAAVTAALAAPLAPAAVAYDRYCGGVLDYECTGWTCSLDCFYRDCTVWLDPLHDPLWARCL
ncbi:MAG TPA: hypothetical protein VF519_11765 [Mycobacteriales bacterium]|jgi:hypothetical protein